MKDKGQILLIVNPIAGGVDKEKLIDFVLQELNKRGLKLIIFETTGEGDIERLENQINSGTWQRILIAGGDGTIKMATQVLMNYDIAVGILPAGSSNGLAKNLEMPEEIEDQFVIALGDDTIDIDIIEINGELCIHIADLGINAELVRHYENSSFRGKFGYILQAIPALITTDYPFEFEIEADGKMIKREGILLAIANANKFGTGANINPKGRINDGLFELVVFKNLKIADILRTLDETNEPDPESMEIFSVRKAVVRCAIPVPFQIDGEFMETVQEIKASLAPNKLRIAVSPTCRDYLATKPEDGVSK